jgi:hypothetical protein
LKIADLPEFALAKIAQTAHGLDVGYWQVRDLVAIGGIATIFLYWRGMDQ